MNLDAYSPKNLLTYPIFREKLSDPERLQQRGFIRFDLTNPQVVYFSPLLGASYMALLAAATAAERGLSVVSHSDRYNALVRSEIMADTLPVGGEKKQEETRERLLLLALRVAVPNANLLANVSVDKILRFRKDSAMVRRRFFDLITREADRIASEERLTTRGLEEWAHEFERQILDHTQELKHELDRTGIKAGESLLLTDGKLRLSGVGTMVAGAVLAHWTLPPVAVGAVALGVVEVLRNWRALRGGLRATSPYSYLLDVSDLTEPGPLLQRAGRGLLRTLRGK